MRLPTALGNPLGALAHRQLRPFRDEAFVMYRPGLRILMAGSVTFRQSLAQGISIPFALITARAAGDPKCLIKALAASGSLVFAPTAAVKTSVC